MRCWLVLLGLVSLAAAQPGDSLAFVRGGRVMFQAAGTARAEPVIAPDPDWSYVHPTWTDSEHLLVMRNRGGEWGRSNVGIVEVGSRPVPPSKVEWLPKLAGSYTIGYNYADAKLHYLKIAKLAEERFQVYFGTAELDGSDAQSRPLEQTMYGLGDPVSKRIRCAPRGYCFVPGFPTDVSNAISLYEPEGGIYMLPFYLDPQWLTTHDLPADFACGDFGGKRYVALGSMSRGLYLADQLKRVVRPLDVWQPDETERAVVSLSFSSDEETIYYEVRPLWWSSGTGSEIRSVTILGGEPTVVLKDAMMPDAMPATGL